MPKPTLISRLPTLRKLAIASAGLFLAALLFLWLALPRIIHSQAEKIVAEQTGHRLSLERPEFNPFDLSLRLHKLRLSNPEGQPLLAFDALLVDISAASLPRRAFVFDAIRLDGLEVTLVELPDGKHNWTPFLAALKSKDEKPETGLPRLDIHSFVLANGRLDFSDRRTTPGFATRVEPLDLNLTEISTLPDDKGQFKVTARTTLGARIDLQGELMLNPLAVVGTFRLDDLQLAQLAPYLRNVLPAPPEGKAALSASYRVGNEGRKLDVTVDQLAAKLSGLQLPLKEAAGPALSIDDIELNNGRFGLARQELAIGRIRIAGGRLDLPQKQNPPYFASLALDDVSINLAENHARIARVALADARLQVTRNAQGQIDLMQAAGHLFGTRPATAKPESDAPGWRYQIGKLDIAGMGVSLRDEAVSPAADLALKDIELSIEGISEDFKAALPVRLSFNAQSGGHFEAEGRVVPSGPTADLRLKLTDLALKPAQPYLASLTTLAIADGRFSTQGRATYSPKGPGYRGSFALRDLRLNEAVTGNPFLTWKTLDSHELTLSRHQLDVGELRLGGLDTQLIIDKDKNINLKQVLRKPVAEPAPDASGPAREAAPFLVNIGRIRFHNGEMDFADHSLVLPFGTHIHGLRGSISNLSSRPGAPGQLELDGEVDDYGMARAVGQIDLFNPTDFMDLRVVFRNVEMTRLTPYSATFAGRKIDSGKLSLDLQYKIDKRQLLGENQIIMDRLTLGERVESATAKNLPLDLAIAILQDSDGRIELGLPVSGSLDDPQFSYGQIVWKAITNVLTKIVTAPFRWLGALFDGGEKLESIAFEAGSALPTPPEREKLLRLAAALAKRPGLTLAVRGIHAEMDRVALQDVQLRRSVLMQSGQRIPEEGDPGPLATGQPKVQAALEKLFAERVGAGDLAALKEGFRRANPGQLEESMAGKMISRLSGLLREKKTLSDDEVTQLKGADFYAVLFDRLRARENITDDRLQSLAGARGENAIGVIKSAGLAAERLVLLPPEKGESEGRDVPIRLTLEVYKGNGK